MQDNPRRKADVLTLESLDTRVTALEGVMEDFKLQMGDVGNEVRANTRLTEEIHGKAEEMYEIFNLARNGFRVLGSIGNGVMRFIAFMGSVAKPLFWTCAFLAAMWAWWKTGTFNWPK